MAEASSFVPVLTHKRTICQRQFPGDSIPASSDLH
jgi:hypothetical protein